MANRGRNKNRTKERKARQEEQRMASLKVSRSTRPRVAMMGHVGSNKTGLAAASMALLAAGLLVPTQKDPSP